jgi:hypothetical protein
MYVLADFRKALPMLLLLLLAGCSLFEPRAITLPEDVDAVATPFVRALQKGDRAASARHVGPGASDELAAGFAKQHSELAKAAPLTPRFITFKPPEMMAPDESEATVVFASKKDGKWSTLEVRLFRIGNERFEVDYWKLGNAEPQPKVYGIEMKELKTMAPFFGWVFGALGLFGAIGIALIIWLVKRKPHLVIPEPEEERRTAAVTRREEE